MKRLLPILAVAAFLLPGLQPAKGADVSINLFYDNLSDGNWYEVADYGYVWQPDAATDPNWRPYTDGYWAYTDQGWTWVSYEDFGWATYHYGRWARLTDYGWVWVPGTEWAPAWVSWRTGGDYVGWAPLPPAGGGEVVYESQPITGHVDIEFGIGPACYNFIDLRYIGEPVLRDRIVPFDRNVTIINNTVNVTNITYNNSTVYNYGPDYATVSRYSVRPIQRLKLERQNVDPLTAVKNGNVTKVQGNTLLVAAPQRLQKAAAQVAPKQIKAKIEQPKVEKGWANVDPKEKAQMEQRYKTETVKNVPKPNIQPRAENAAANANANAAAASAADRAGRGRRKGEKAEPNPVSAPGAVASPNAIQQQQGKAAKNKNRPEHLAATPVPAVSATENRRANAAEERNKQNRHEENVAGRGGNASANERNEVRSKPGNINANAAQMREKEERAKRSNEERLQQQREAQQREVQQREAQQRETQQRAPQQREVQPERREATQTAPVNQSAPGPARQPREGAQPNPQAQRNAQAAEQQRKAKAKKNESEATPPPQ
jgi:hypothetical protein